MKILVVDDQPKIVEVVATALRREHFAVDTAADGEEGLQKAQKNAYDAIVLDIMMPKKSGFEVISALRITNVQTPILVISSKVLVKERVHSLNLGADDYLIKNFSLEEMVARVKALIRRRHFLRSNVLKCRDVRINLSDLSVKKGEKEIHLSKKEFGILVELVKRKNTVVSRETLLESVWGEHDAEVLSNTVDVHIRTLRGKLREKSEKNPLIKTIRGYGYSIKTPPRLAQK